MYIHTYIHLCVYFLSIQTVDSRYLLLSYLNQNLLTVLNNLFRKGTATLFRAHDCLHLFSVIKNEYNGKMEIYYDIVQTKLIPNGILETGVGNENVFIWFGEFFISLVNF